MASENYRSNSIVIVAIARWFSRLRILVMLNWIDRLIMRIVAVIVRPD
jgi:hypothetical protein